jgi:hypothetical protein
MVLRVEVFVWVLTTFLICICPACVLSYEAEPLQGFEYLRPLEVKEYQMREDYGPDPSSYYCALQYYYYIPCPTYSWFWGYYGWQQGDIIGACFRVGDQGAGGFEPCNPLNASDLGWISVLDFAGYGTVYPGLYTIEMDVYCADETPSPRSHLWNSGPLETHIGWNYFEVDPPLNLQPCWGYEEWPPAGPTIVVTMSFVGSEGNYPMIAFDNIGTAIDVGCVMHDYGCTPAWFPRSRMGSDGRSVHSGYMGRYPFEHWPPLPFADGVFTDHWGSGWYGFVELAWQIYLARVPMGTAKRLHSTTWGGIKSLYR